MQFTEREMKEWKIKLGKPEFKEHFFMDYI